MRALIFVIVLLLSFAATADKKLDKLVTSGVRCFNELNYGCAITKLGRAQDLLDTGAELPRTRALEVCRTLAFALASVEKHPEAEATFDKCFKIEPAFRLDPKVISPKIYADYRSARAKQLATLIRGRVEPPPFPDPYPPPAPGPSDLEVHVPTGLTAGATLRDDQALRHHFGVLAGTRLVFGADAEDFNPGFAVGLEYGYQFTDIVGLSFGAQFSQHGTARGDTKSGFPASLYVMEPGLGLRFRFAVGEWVDLSIGVTGGLTLAGLGGIGGTTAGMVAVPASVMIRPMPEFAVGISVIPTLSISKLSTDELGTSLTLPLLLRFEAHF
ncbi:MAG: hypothetical protein ACI9OJ_000234 [Myxococcota bacterium]|jgi:hypothetical protein